MTDESALTTWGNGAQPSRARLRGSTVLRDAGPWSPAVVALLRHFETVGFTGAPRPVGSGFAPDGREVVTLVPGSSRHPHQWQDEDVLAIGQLLRRAHRAAATFTPPPDARWRDWFGRALPGDHPVIGHCDVGPWNVVIAEDGTPALIDWEFAGPVDAIWELAQAAWLNAQLHDDETADRLGLPPVADRARQVRLLLEGYELPALARQGFVDRMIELAVHAAAAETLEHAVHPDTTSAVTDSGYPVLWAVTWRTRDAAWMLQHRHLLERAIA
ncbi:phosphotransferase [Cellulomonas sp. 179-A 4D5 NHS]|uniref:phosphotransferase n=1 Tax=Cellulomonas sp. 179-A 4D5 NHS TaxID=3142378 RepID=UPI0039A10C4C